ncbi:hypothetical protein OH77DRAFT_1421066 [Trametes cingulata]|nr:hypothetical protein OH77DRAFT_1421066 [Trametes cingulata]
MPVPTARSRWACVLSSSPTPFASHNLRGKASAAPFLRMPARVCATSTPHMRPLTQYTPYVLRPAEPSDQNPSRRWLHAIDADDVDALMSPARRRGHQRDDKCRARVLMLARQPPGADPRVQTAQMHVAPSRRSPHPFRRSIWKCDCQRKTSQIASEKHRYARCASFH